MAFFGIFIALIIGAILSFWGVLVEATYLTVKQPSLSLMQKDGSKRAAAALKITNEKTKLISVTTFIDTISNVVLATTAGILLSQAFGPYGWLVSVVIGSLVIMVFLDLVPKTIGIEDAVGMAVFLAPLTVMTIDILSPVAKPLMNIARTFATVIGGKRGYNENEISEELESIIDMLDEHGRIEPDAGKLVRNALASSRLDVKDATTPIERIISVDASTTVMEVLRVMGSSRHPRIPVFDRDKGEFVGVVTFRSLAKGLSEGRLNESVSRYTVDAARIGADESIASVADRMSGAGVTIAFVYREGKMIGVITLTDLLERILGFKISG